MTKIQVSWGPVSPDALVAAVKGGYGRSNSLKWPWLFDKLRAKGYDKSKAAAISNSRLKFRKGGRKNVLKANEAHNPNVLKRLAKADSKGKHSTARSLKASVDIDHLVELACRSKACAPPPVGSGGSKSGSVPSGRKTRVITADLARGDSRPVSLEEFHRLANRGHDQLDTFSANSSPTTGLDRNWGRLKQQTYAEVQKSWGGATIDSHTGVALPQGANKYALTVKGGVHDTISIHEGASPVEFNTAMNRAKQAFGPILERESHYLGVFHDDVHNRIDFDPVIVVTDRADVDTIGAASYSIGGAYNFMDGNGYWPPHVAEG